MGYNVLGENLLVLKKAALAGSKINMTITVLKYQVKNINISVRINISLRNKVETYQMFCPCHMDFSMVEWLGHMT